MITNRRKQLNPKPTSQKSADFADVRTASSVGSSEHDVELEMKLRVHSDQQSDTSKSSDIDDGDDLENPLVIVTEVESGAVSTAGATGAGGSSSIRRKPSAAAIKSEGEPYSMAAPGRLMMPLSFPSTTSLDGMNGGGGGPLSPSASQSSSSSSFPSPRLSSANGSPHKSPSSASKPRLTAPSKTRRKSDKILPVADEHGLEAFICPVCQEVLPDNHRLTKHIRSHNIVPPTASTVNTCTICNKVLSSQSSLDRHMLVHSGERPFQCNICGMAFTTNGNMHRHSRIHEKEASSSGSPFSASTVAAATDSERTASKMLSEMAARAQRGKRSKVNATDVGASPAAGSSPASVGGVLMHGSPLPSTPPSLMVPTPRSGGSSGGKRKLEEDENNNSSLLLLQYAAAGSSGGDQQQRSASKKRSPDTSSIAAAAAGRTGSSLLQMAVDSTALLAKQADEQRVESDARLCPVCSKEGFLSVSGVYVHVASCHPNYPWKCSACLLVFRSGHLLRSHQAVSHGCKKTGGARSSSAASTYMSSLNADDDSIASGGHVVGFQDLTFVDFSARKFPQISRVLCETQRRRFTGAGSAVTGVAATSFSCEHCRHAFPCKAALEAHQCTHFPQYNTNCAACDCRFDTPGECEQHSLIHVANNVLASYASHRTTEDNLDVRDAMVQEEFLIVLGLKAKQQQSAVTTTTPKRLDTNGIANKTGTAGIPLMKPVPKSISSSSAFADIMFAEQSQQLLARNDLLSLSRQQVAEKSLMTSGSGNKKSYVLEQLARQVKQRHEAIDVDGKMVTVNGDRRRALLATEEGMDQASADGDEYSQSSEELDDGSGLGSSLNIKLPLMLLEHPLASIQKTAGSNSSSSNVLADLAQSMAELGSVPPFKCSYCSQSFPSMRYWKAHMRTHLGQAPYKCDQCNYSSADKSTLVRHLRTHNGERPYQCTVCHFAFTTKANCERHIRKKHGYSEKDDIDRLITFVDSNTSDAVSNSGSAVEAFRSPDTVCKYCGQDFHFFRALKHHLRSQHSHCRAKPFVCKLCLSGFTSKANCMRHVQKQHGDSVSPHQIEDCIRVNDIAAAAAAAEEGEDMANSDSDDDVDNGASLTEASLGDVGGGVLSSSAVKQVPLFHPAFGALSMTRLISYPKMLPDQSKIESTSMLRQQLQLPPAKPTILVRNMLGSKGFVDAAKSAVGGFEGIKQEANEEEYSSTEQPLDFSMKPTVPTVAGNRRQQPKQTDSRLLDLSGKATASAECDSEEPMDLSKATRGIGSLADSFPLAAGGLQLGNKASINPHLLLQAATRSGRPSTSSSLLVQRLVNGANANSPLSSPWRQDGSSLQSTANVGRATAGGSRVRNSSPAAAAATQGQMPVSLTGKASASASASVPAARVSQVVRKPMPVYGKWLVESPGGTGAGGKPTTAAGGRLSAGEMPQQQAQSDAGDSRQFMSPRTDEEMDEDEDESLVDSEDYRAADEMQLAEDEEPASETGSMVSVLLRKRARAADTDADGTIPIAPRKKKRNSYSNSPHKLRCPQCPRAFPWISSLKRHLLTHTGQKPYKCTHCPIMFSTKSNRERHMIRKHGLDIHDPVTRQMMDRPFKCHICVFSSFAALGNLLKHYTDKHPDEELPESVATLVEMSGGVQVVSAMCDDGLDDNDTCSRQSANSQAKDSQLNDMDDCDEDSDNSMSSKMTSTAPQSRPPSVPPMSLSTGGPSPASLPAAATPVTDGAYPERDSCSMDQITDCWKCGSTFSSRKQLLKHLKEHAVDLPFKCFLCDASFEGRSEVLTHTSTRHRGEWDTLRDKNRIGEKIEAFAAHVDKIVEETLVTSAANEALEQGQGQSELPVDSKEDLDDALHIESDYAQRKVYCAFCAKRFWSLQDLRRHMRSHTGERPFECNICRKRFTLKHSMMRHRRRHIDGGLGDEASYCSDDDMSLLTDDKDATQDHLSQVSYGGANSRETSLSPALSRHSDILQKLLGVDSADTLEHMLSSSADKAAEILGISCS